ncbi:MAG: response regulator, partial [Rivularia sp. ALOHA_DT_140]|nr:response regulator [Rivularia sp. ALOHA_DT_140]
DTGVGIPPEKTREIFLPFHQLINGESLNEGSGLGLTISQKIVNLMGGEIKVEAAPGKGSCFYFDICFLEIENTQLNDNLPLEIQPVGIKDKHPKILVVDDNQINRAVVVNYLKRLGFEISEASNGKEGLEKVENLRPDLILLDLVMPIMDGFETTEALRNNPEFKDLPIIIISANAMFDAQLSSYRIGCNAFLSKPIDLKLLIKSIAQLIDLEWIYPQSAKLALSTDKPTQQIAASQNTDTSDSILAPSNEEVTQLLHLTQMGDIEAILDLAKQLESLDTKYLKFSQKVSELAQSFEQHKLLRFLEEFLK